MYTQWRSDSFGLVIGHNRVGGLIGDNYRGNINQTYSKGDVESSGKSSGGLIGVNDYGFVHESYSTGGVTNSFDSYPYVGGLIGWNYGHQSVVRDSYSTGNVTAGIGNIGGLIGYSDGYVEKSYSTGFVTGTPGSVGGLVGRGVTTRISDSYWNTETSGQETSDGGEGKTTSEMQTQSTFTDAGWDFTSIWYMKNYPDLQWNE